VKFCRLIRPGGPGWKNFLDRMAAKGINIADLQPGSGHWDVPGSLLSVFLGCLTVYSALFGIGFWIYANYLAATISSITAVVSAYGLSRIWSRGTVSAKKI